MERKRPQYNIRERHAIASGYLGSRRERGWNGSGGGVQSRTWWRDFQCADVHDHEREPNREWSIAKQRGLGWRGIRADRQREQFCFGFRGAVERFGPEHNVCEPDAVASGDFLR